MKRILLAGLVLAGAWAVSMIPTPAVADDPCAGVRCMACPDGTVWSPKPNDCCRCVPA